MECPACPRPSEGADVDANGRDKPREDNESTNLVDPKLVATDGTCDSAPPFPKDVPNDGEDIEQEVGLPAELMQT